MKMWRKRKIILIFGVIFMTGVLLSGCGKKKTEIVWYITNPRFYGADTSKLEPYQEIKTKRFELFNKRLEELGIPAKVIFKYAEEVYGETAGEYIKNQGTFLKTLMEEDEEADIVKFSTMEYRQFVELDSYFESEGMRRAKAALPEKIWEVNRINEKSYQIPRGNVSIKETVYTFRSSFLEKHQIELVEEEIKKMSPREVIEWLLPYFEENRIADDRYYLTAAGDLFYETYFLGKSIPLLPGTQNGLSLQLDTLQVTEELSRGFDMYDWIFKENIDAHRERSVQSAQPVFMLNDIPILEELQRKKEEENPYCQVRLGNFTVCTSLGNGVLKSSTEKDLAIEVLAASVYDEELSNLMIYGVPGKDYYLQDGHAVYTDSREVSSVGSFSQIGNNLIAYPNEAEVLQKREVVESLLEKTPIIPYSNFVPEWNEEMLDKAAKIAEICEESMKEVSFVGIEDLEEYLSEQRERLKEAGMEELTAELQNQINGWRE